MLQRVLLPRAASLTVLTPDSFTQNQLKNYAASTISWIGSVQLFALFLLGLPSGRLFDSGYFRYQLAGGSILWCFGMYMLSLSSTYYQFFLSYAVCLGVRRSRSPSSSCRHGAVGARVGGVPDY